MPNDSVHSTSSKKTKGMKEMFLFNNALNIIYLRLYGVGYIGKDHMDSKRENPLLPLHGLRFPMSNKGYSISIIP